MNRNAWASASLQLTLALLLALAWPGQAAVRYVNVNHANLAPPYTNWATAATVIQVIAVRTKA